MEILVMINSYAWVFMAAMLLVLLILLVQYSKLNGQVKQLKKKYAAVTRGVDGADWGQLLERLSEEAEITQGIQKEQQEEMKSLGKRMNSSLNRVEIVHYNAFDFTYGELSFSMAVLDDLGTGFIFTNIHNRDDARCYCKRVVSGQSKHPLSDEEKQVLEDALNGSSIYSRSQK